MALYSKYPFSKQLDAMDCGPSCLQMIAKYYGKHYSLKTLREYSQLSRNGVSMLGLSYGAKSIGLQGKCVKINWDQLSNQVPLPCIVHWNKMHFIVVYNIDRKKRRIQIADPAHALIKLKEEDFLKHWITDGQKNGFVLLLSPTNDFFNYTEEVKTFKLSQFREYIKSYKHCFSLLIIITLLGSLVSILFPYITQTIVDQGIKNSNTEIIVILFSAQLVLTFGQLCNELIQNWLMLHITTRIGITLISNYLNKLMRLPISFFDQKKIGDLIQRISDNSRIHNFLTSTLISIIVAFVVFVSYTFVIAKYDTTILWIFILGSFIYISWVFLFLNKRRELDYREFQESSSMKSNLVQLISGMQDIKLNNCEKQKRWEWERIQVRLFKINIKSLALGQTQQVGGVFINQIKNISISYLAAISVVNGNMTLGAMLAMQYILGQLNAPLSKFVSFIQEMQDAKISLERLNEVHNKEDEEPECLKKNPNIPQSAEIRLINVSFRYEGSEEDNVLNNINLTIEAKKVTAIVGTSGSGKTTLLKLLLGFYSPCNGEIKVGENPLSEYSESAWRSNCGVVMQESFIFSDTIANNIGIIDDNPDRERVIYAANIANIESFVNLLPLGYETNIGSEGNGLSAGQKQRILIARAVYKDPSYIFLDEATNALDAKNETIIMRNLQKFYAGRTVVVIAHRLSTVKNADNIIVLNHGNIIESGTHDQLILQKGTYYTLIKNQLELGN